MSAGEIRVGDVGTVFERTVKDGEGAVVDVSGATTMEFIFNKPDGSAVMMEAEHVTDGSDGKLRYITVEDDLDVAGDWQLQVYVVLGGGEWHSDIGSFKVHRNLAVPEVP